jgi:hypothetical protein
MRMISRVVGVVVAVAVAIVLVKSLPDVARYLRMREM